MLVNNDPQGPERDRNEGGCSMLIKDRKRRLISCEENED